MRYLLLALLLVAAACNSPTDAPADMSGEWGISGAASGECGFYALATITGTVEDFSGTAVLNVDDVPISGGRERVQLGPLALTVETVTSHGIGPHLSGSFDCDGSSGAWSMYRY